MSSSHGDGTRVVAAGQVGATPGEPLLPGPVLAAPYRLDPDEERPSGRFYARNENPTWSAFEAALSELEGGPAVVFPSGMAAATAVLQTLLRPGDRVVVPADGYYQVRSLLAEDLPWYDVLAVPTAEVDAWAAGGGAVGAALVLIETPCNPGLDVCDIAAAAAAVHGGGGLLAVDNTLATPLGQRPLELGADLSWASDTKAVSGHSDLLLGHVACADPVRAQRLRDWRTRSGAIPGPFEVWLAHRSLGTLDLRLQRQAANALALAAAAAGHAAVQGVRYPWRPGDPAYDLVRRQMRRPVGVLNLRLADADAVRRFLGASRLLTAATSFGGLHSTADRRAQFGDDVPPGFVRISCGVEDTADLVADLREALDSLGSAG